MQKALTYALIAVAAWAWLELQSKGTHGAFGGALSGVLDPVESVREEPELPPRITEQIRQHVQATIDRSAHERSRQAERLR